MLVRHGGARYELDDEWWAEARMAQFVPIRRAFRHDPEAFPQFQVIEVPVDAVRPLERRLSHGVFNDSPSAGTARERVVRILTGFRDDSPIPPVEVVRLADGPYAFELYHGAHRFYCAVAAGFTAVPAVAVAPLRVEDVDMDAEPGGRTSGCS